MTLNLTAKGAEQERILAYLQKNASETLAKKINYGVYIEKDGKRLLNKKTLETFMVFAGKEALKLIAENERKGKVIRCIDDPIVYGWAIHYFEEESIEGKLYNEDGTEYKPVVNSEPKPATAPVKAEPPKPKQQQGSLFDMLATQPSVTEQTNDHKTVDEADEEPTEEDIAEAMEKQEQVTPTPLPPAKPRPSEWYGQYLSVKEKHKDSILFYRLGDFYEMFGNDACTCAHVLDLTLTGRECGLQERVPMTGVPFHAADAYIAKLTERGYKVVVAERLDGTVQEKLYEPQNEDLQVDEETGEVLPVEEMRKFDGDIEEPNTPVLQNDEPDDGDEFPDFDAKAFDPEALCVLDELFGKSMILR